jgi:hypothetical protein
MSKNRHREYKVTCLENGITKESGISFDDAIGLIKGIIDCNTYQLSQKSSDIEYVRSLFEDKLIGEKLSKLDDIIKEEIAGKIKGTIYSIPRQKMAIEQIYKTDNFVITAKCEKGKARGVTSIDISEKSKIY